LRGLRLRVGRTVIFPHPREKNRFVVAAHNSFIGQLAEIVEKSMGGYPISLEMGVWFILTGEFVHEDPVRIRYRTVERPELLSRTTITLDVESWLPPEEILAQYRHAQNQILGGTPRSLKRKTVALFEFVNLYKGKKRWSELFDAWNKTQSGQRFRDRSHLFTTYMRALEYIAGVKPAKDKDGKVPKAVGIDSQGFPIFADKWYLLHATDDEEKQHSYTGTFESRKEAQDDPRSKDSEVLTAKQLVARLEERTKTSST
jgi:hypothetical protein